jgi:hypothetical protein
VAGFARHLFLFLTSSDEIICLSNVCHYYEVVTFDKKLNNAMGDK